jgi:diguanylate cyclase (GGDEF)-like protein
MYEVGTATLQNAAEPHSQALLFLDLDRFKLVNDTMGHDVGDELLTEVAARLRTSVRVGDTLARMGGDEFAVLLPRSDAEQALGIAERILGQLAQPFHLRDQRVHVGASIGIAVNPGGSKPFKDLLIEADIAMYRAKDDGGGLHLYEPHLDAVGSEHPRIRSTD